MLGLETLSEKGLLHLVKIVAFEDLKPRMRDRRKNNKYFVVDGNSSFVLDGFSRITRYFKKSVISVMSIGHLGTVRLQHSTFL